MIKPASFALGIAAAGILAAGQVVFAQTADQGTTSSQSSSTQSTTSGKHHNMQTTGSTGSSGALSASEKSFATKAAEGNVAEIKFAALAEQKSTDESVKNYARKVTEDHTKANDDLKSIAEKKGITLPDAMDSKDQAEYDRLSKLSGDQFDKAYLRYMEKDHHKAIAEFRKEADKGQDPDLKSFASSTLPTLDAHLRSAEANLRREGTGTNANAARGTQTNTDNTGMPTTNPNSTNPNSTNPNSTTRPRP